MENGDIFLRKAVVMFSFFFFFQKVSTPQIPRCVFKAFRTETLQTLGEHYVSLTVCRMAQMVLDNAEKFLHPEGEGSWITGGWFMA